MIALGERDSDSIDGDFGPDAWRQEARAANLPLSEIQRRAASLSAEILRHASIDPPRSAFLAGQVGAIAARADILLGRRPPFAVEARSLFGVEPDRPDAVRMSAVRDELDRALPGGGSLPARLAAAERKALVPGDRLPRAFRQAIDLCRARTVDHLALPSDEGVDLEFVDDYPWTAFTRYQGGHRSRVIINTSVGLTVDDVLRVACHETYPGHHVISVLTDDRLVRTQHRVEFAVQPLFSPQALAAEGAASIAPDVAFTEGEREDVERRVLCPLAGLSPPDAVVAAQVERLADLLMPLRVDLVARYLDGDLEFARAAAALERETATVSADAFLKFANRFRSYIITYTRGPALAAAYVDARARREDVAGRWQAYVELATNPGLALGK